MNITQNKIDEWCRSDFITEKQKHEIQTRNYQETFALLFLREKNPAFYLKNILIFFGIFLISFFPFQELNGDNFILGISVLILICVMEILFASISVWSLKQNKKQNIINMIFPVMIFCLFGYIASIGINCLSRIYFWGYLNCFFVDEEKQFLVSDYFLIWFLIFNLANFLFEIFNHFKFKYVLSVLGLFFLVFGILLPEILLALGTTFLREFLFCFVASYIWYIYVFEPRQELKTYLKFLAEHNFISGSKYLKIFTYEIIQRRYRGLLFALVISIALLFLMGIVGFF